VRTISLVASKGGVGKTCLAAALAVAAATAHPSARVGIIDADPQGSLTAWWNWRGELTPQLFPTGGLPLSKVARALARAGIGYLFVDTAPGLSEWQRQAIEIADIALVPCQPCAIDLAAIETTEAVIAATGKTSACVLNRAVFRTRLAGQAVRAIRESGRALLPVLHQRMDVAESMARGRTCLETNPEGAAARELRALWDAVEVLLDARRFAPDGGR